MNLKKKLYLHFNTYYKDKDKPGLFKEDGGESVSPTSENLSLNVEYLDAKLDKTVRENSAYDIYKITDSANSELDIRNKIALLQPNTALVVNTKAVEYNYGDIVIKTEDDRLLTIKAESQGIYKPISIKKKEGATYQITYTFETSLPEEGSTLPIEIEDISESKEGVTYGLTVERTGRGTWSTLIDLVRDSEGHPIFPIIKMYSVNGEQVDAEIEIKPFGDDQYGISDIPQIVEKVVVR